MKKIRGADINKAVESESHNQQKGYVRLDAEGIKSHIVGKTFLGSFPPFFKYIVSINRDGSLEGKNDYQHYETGKWIINLETNTLSVSWNFGWENTTSHVYLVDNVIKMIDTASGKLNTSFDQKIENPDSIKAFEI